MSAPDETSAPNDTVLDGEQFIAKDKEEDRTALFSGRRAAGKAYLVEQLLKEIEVQLGDKKIKQSIQMIVVSPSER